MCNPMVRMMLRVLALLAVLVMPLSMATESAAAASHHGAMAASPSGHCDSSPKSELPTGIADCGMACAAALPAVGPTPDGRSLALCIPEVRAAKALTGLPPETATPPPKSF